MIDAKIKQKAIQHYLNGKSVQQTATRFNVTGRTIYKWLKSEKVVLRKIGLDDKVKKTISQKTKATKAKKNNLKLTKVEFKFLENLYLGGKSYREIAWEMDINYNTFMKIKNSERVLEITVKKAKTWLAEREVERGKY